MNWKLAHLLIALQGSMALGQVDQIFGSGKPLNLVEEDIDRRFLRTRVAKALKSGTNDPNCVQLVGALMTALAETGPYLHQRDENFQLAPELLQVLNTQLSNAQFPAAVFLSAMVRRVQIDQKLPDEWMSVAEQINPYVGTIDMGKLRMMQEALNPIESLYFTLPKLKELHDAQVVKANSATKAEATTDFRDAYLDRRVAWGGLKLVDIVLPKKGKKAAKSTGNFLTAVLSYQPPNPTPNNPLALLTSKKQRPLKIVAQLADIQYLDVTKLSKGKRLLIRGQLWDVNGQGTEFQVRSAHLFEDRDWTQGTLLASPNAALECPLAYNDLTGLAPNQPGGFGH